MANDTGRQASTPSGTSATVTKTVGRWEKKRYKLRTTAATAEANLKREQHNLRFSLHEKISYYSMREQALSRFFRFFTGLQVFLGTGAVASMAEVLPVPPIILIGIAALAGVLLLVLDPAGAARDHRTLRGRYHHILADFEESDCSVQVVRSLRASKLRVDADAPPIYRAVQAMAYNAAVNGIYSEDIAKRHRYEIKWYQTLFANWFPMRAFQFSLKKTPQ